MHFEVQISPDNASWSLAGTSPTASFQATGLTPGTLYYFKVKGVSTGGSSSFSNVVNLTTTASGSPPAAPTTLNASVISVSEIDLTWIDASSNEANFETGYSLDNSNWATNSLAANTTSYAVTGLVHNSLYYFRVRATNAYGNSSYATTTATTLNEAPTAPTTLAAAAASKTKINLSWVDTSDNETGFEIQRSADGSTWSGVLYTTAVNVTAYSDTTVAAGETWYYRVRAINASGNSSYASTANATTAWDLSDVSNRVMDLDADTIAGADNATVASWVDSVNSWAFTEAAAKPTLRTAFVNSHNAVYFPQTKYLSTADSGAMNALRNLSGCSLYVVSSTHLISAGSRSLIEFANNSTGVRLRIQANVVAAHYTVAGRRLDADSVLQAKDYSGAVTADTWHVIGTRIDYSTAHIYGSQDGASGVDTTFQTAGSSSDTAGTIIVIGANIAKTSNQWTGGNFVIGLKHYHSQN